MAQLLSSGNVRYAYVGITTEDLTPSIAKKFGYAAKRGALIDAVTTGSAAAQAGLEAGPNDAVFEGQALKVGGDAVVAIDGMPVDERRGRRPDRLRAPPARTRPSRFTVVRGGAAPGRPRHARRAAGANGLRKPSRGNLLP